MERQRLSHVVRPVRDRSRLEATRPRESLSSPLQYIVEPTIVSLPPPQEPSGSWVTRSLVALLRQHRLPTRVSRWLDRSLIALGLPTKTVRVHGLQLPVRRLTADEFFVREVLIDRQYNPAGFEINPTDNVLDIGGNVGAFAVGAAIQAGRGRVISVEPVQENFSLLVRNVGLNKLKNVIPVRAAVLSQRRPATATASVAPAASATSAMTTHAPSSMKHRAIVAPIPRAAPVTRATLPSRRPLICSPPVDETVSLLRNAPSDRLRASGKSQ